jgi:hypothetical protein
MLSPGGELLPICRFGTVSVLDGISKAAYHGPLAITRVVIAADARICRGLADVAI